MPVSKANITAVVGRNAPTIDYNAKEDEAKNSNNLYHAEHEFNCPITLTIFQRSLQKLHTFSVPFHTKELHCDQDTQEDNDPDSYVVLVPIGYSDTGSGDLKWQRNQPANAVLPAHGKAPTQLVSH